MRYLVAILAALGLTGCKADETVSGYGGAGTEWHLKELNGQPFEARATLTFPEEGKIAGQAPCNRYFGAQTAPYPWFNAKQVGATRMACPHLDKETQFLTALGQMTLSEITGNTLILSNQEGQEMVFLAGP